MVWIFSKYHFSFLWCHLLTCLKYAATIWMPNFPLTLEVYPTEADTRKVIETSTETLFRSPWWIRPHWSIFNWAEFDFRPMSLFQIGALRYLKGILCKRLKKKKCRSRIFRKKSLLYFLRERDYNFFVHFQCVCILDKFSVNEKKKENWCI